jgi:DNA repair and recombination protein RAD52
MAAFNLEQKAQLSKLLDPAFVKQRSQAGRQLSYIEGWHAIAEANRIFGFDGWDRETLEMRPLGEPLDLAGKWRVSYAARVRITVHAMTVDANVIRDGCGFGSGIDQSLGRAHESAIKEAETDAMKRALMTFGNPFGLALYDKQQRGVGVEEEEPEPEPELGSITVNGEQQRLSAYAARKGDLWEPLVASLRACETVVALHQWTDEHTRDFERLPMGWLEELRAEWSRHASEIKARG